MTVAPTRVTPPRATVVDWTLPFDYFTYMLVTKKHTAGQHAWTVFSSPFNWQVRLVEVKEDKIPGLSDFSSEACQSLVIF